MYSQNGEVNSVKWYAKYLGGRTFKLMVSDLVEMYECEYEPIFGVDVADHAKMCEIMDSMQKKIEDDMLMVNNSFIENEIMSENDLKLDVYKANKRRRDEENEAKYQEWLANRDIDNPFNSFTEFMFGKKDFKEAVEDITMAMLKKS